MSYYIFIFAVLGAATGSFLNVIIDRFPLRQSLLFPPSHCPVCQKRLAVVDLVPVLSYLWLKGRCRYCRAPIPRRILWVESGTMLAFVLLLWRYGLSVELGVMCCYWSLLVVIVVTNVERGIIPDKVVYPAGAVVLLINVFSREPGLVNGLLGAGVGLGVMALPLGLGRRGLGWGEVKLAGLTGLMLGFPDGLVALFLAVVGGVLAGLSRARSKGKERGKVLTFVPFLAVATVVMLLWGRSIVNWYLSLFQ